MTTQIVAWIFIGLWTTFSGIIYWKDDWYANIFEAIMGGALYAIGFMVLTPFLILLFATAFGL